MSREEALAWWYTLSFEQKFIELIKAKHIIVGGLDRDVQTLTGREIQTIKNNNHEGTN